MLDSKQAKVLDLVELAVTEALKTLGESWVELSYCNGSEVFESDSNSQPKEVKRAA